MSLIEKAKDQEVELKVLRGGSEKTFKVKAEKHAANTQHWNSASTQVEVHTVTVTKEGDQPAKITVKRGEASWEVP